MEKTNPILTISSPSNIALVKYMGKSDLNKNYAENSSLSATLSSVSTRIDIYSAKSEEFSIEIRPLGIVLNRRETDRFSNHFFRVFELVRNNNGVSGSPPDPCAVILETSNSFPKGAGIASSASAFSALTLAAASIAFQNIDEFIKKLDGEPDFFNLLASTSRLGSGSSCRSFYGPYCSWDGKEEVKRIDEIHGTFSSVVDLVAIIDDTEKTVSSSRAHEIVKSSPLWVGRADRADSRSERVVQCLKSGDWNSAAEEVFSEALEMHSLFHTSNPSFSYWQSGTTDLLGRIMNEWNQFELKPLVTLDAGPNIHFLLPKNGVESFRNRLGEYSSKFNFLEDGLSAGPKISNSRGDTLWMP